MAIEETAHGRWLRRVLGGEVLNDEVGIWLRGGPFDGRIQIVALDATGRPPSRVRGRRSEDAWQVYALAADAAAASSWVYVYLGEEPIHPVKQATGLVHHHVGVRSRPRQGHRAVKAGLTPLATGRPRSSRQAIGVGIDDRVAVRKVTSG